MKIGLSNMAHNTFLLRSKLTTNPKIFVARWLFLVTIFFTVLEYFSDVHEQRNLNLYNGRILKKSEHIKQHYEMLITVKAA